jgi:integrase
MRLKLTDMTIAKLPQSAEYKTYWDMLLPAFGIRVGLRSKTFIIVTTKGARIKIGRYPNISLADARSKARLLLSGTPTPIISFGDAVQSYLRAETPKMGRSHAREVERILTKTFGLLDRHSLALVTTQHIVDVLDTLKHTPGQALHVHTRIKTFFKWAKARHLITLNPIEELSPPSKPGERDRVLSDKELIAVYSAARTVGYPFGHIVRLSIHTGLRRANLAELEWAWITDDLITIPGSSMKTEVPFLLPNFVQDILTETPPGGRFVFPSEAGTPFSAFSKNKKKLDAIAGVADWNLHDCRRTFRTNLSRWQCCTSETAELLLAHQVGSKIRRIYDRYDRLPEKREAMERYTERLQTIIA